MFELALCPPMVCGGRTEPGRPGWSRAERARRPCRRPGRPASPGRRKAPGGARRPTPRGEHTPRRSRPRPAPSTATRCAARSWPRCAPPWSTASWPPARCTRRRRSASGSGSPPPPYARRCSSSPSRAPSRSCRTGAFGSPSAAPRELAELAEVRALIEVPVMLRLARTVPARRWAELRPLAEATVEAAATGDRAGYAERDRAFHRAVLALAGNQQLVQVADELHRRAQWPLTARAGRAPRRPGGRRGRTPGTAGRPVRPEPAGRPGAGARALHRLDPLSPADGRV